MYRKCVKIVGVNIVFLDSENSEINNNGLVETDASIEKAPLVSAASGAVCVSSMNESALPVESAIIPSKPSPNHSSDTAQTSPRNASKPSDRRKTFVVQRTGSPNPIQSTASQCKPVQKPESPANSDAFSCTFLVVRIIASRNSALR